jgi:serine/threonine protein kinase
MKVLGKGNWGTVYEAFDEKTNINVAVKAIPKIFMKQTPKLE